MSVKNEVLKILENHTEKDVSGEEIAQTLGVSRNAVWKAVNSLKKDGCEILSVTNRGYKLVSKIDFIDSDNIRSFLPQEFQNTEIFCYNSVTSTNDEAKRLVASGNNNMLLIVADEQTAGRGRNGHSFYSPSQTGIYMTIVIHPQLKMTVATSATTAAACAVVSAIQTLTEKKPKIKWVNDVFLDGKKICGILTEAVSDFESGTVQSLFVGIGINMSTTDFPQELNGVAASLCCENVTRNALAALITANFLEYAKCLEKKAHMPFYKEHSFVLNKRITYLENNIQKEATAVDIDDNGGLIVKDDNKNLHTLQSGEISVKIKK